MKKMSCFCAAIVFFTALCSPGAASSSPKNDALTEAPFQSDGDGPLYYVDYTCFRGIEDKTYTEFYFQVGYNHLQFIKTAPKEFKATYELELVVFDMNESRVERYHNVDTISVHDYEQTKSRTKARVCQTGYSLEPGNYIIQVTVKDLETLHTSYIREVIPVENYQSPKLQVSEIQFSQKIELAPPGRPYVKNQRYIEPNAIRTFAHGLADVFVYFEIYNLSLATENPKPTYSAEFVVYDAKGKKVGGITRYHQKPGDSAAHSLRLPVDNFLAGEYTLLIKVTDEDSGQTARTSKEFMIVSQPVTMTEFESWIE